MKIFDENVPVNINYSVEQLKEIYRKQEIVFAKIISISENGYFEVKLGNKLFARLPFEDLDMSEYTFKAKTKVIGRHIMAVVTEIDEYDNIFLSRKSVQKQYQKDVLDKIESGTRIDTRVLSLTKFGAFVDMGIGFVALLPIGDISIARFGNIHDVLQIGQEISVLFKEKSEKGYVVSHRELLGTWEENLNKFQIGDTYIGIVREITNYGAFIELTPNLTGLSDIPKDIEIKVGDSVKVKYKSSSPERLKVKLQIQELSEKKYETKFDYIELNGRISFWLYTPQNSIKKISTIF